MNKNPSSGFFCFLITGVTLFFLAFLSQHAAAQVDITGFYRNYNAVQTLPNHQILIGRNRVRLDLGYSSSSGEVVLSNDIGNLYSESPDSLNYELREAFVDVFFRNSDLRIGKQILVWGRAEGTFVTDILSPVDFSEFLTQDFPDLRSGITAFSYTRYFGSNFLQGVANPIFTPNPLPSPDSRWFPDPVLSIGVPFNYRAYDPEPSLENTQWALRWGYRSDLNLDLDLGLLYWHHPSPRYSKEFVTGQNQNPSLRLTETYLQSAIAMYSGSLRLSDKLILTSEAAFYQRRNFDYLSEPLRNINLDNPSPSEQLEIIQIFNQNEDGFLTRRPWLISMIGLQYELMDWILSGQFVNEHIFDYDFDILQNQDYHYFTLLVNRSFARDTFGFRGFGRYNLQGRDYWLNPELSYSGIDAFEASVGAQLFGGDDPRGNFGHLSFGSYTGNSFGYLQFTAFF